MDANAVIMVAPLNVVKESNEYFKPYPILFNSPQVLDFVYEQYAVLKSVEESTYRSGNRSYKGAVYYSVDRESIVKYEQINAKGDFSATEFLHGLGYAPCFKTYGIIVKDGVDDALYSSRIAPIVPSLNEAAREWSDLQAEVVRGDIVRVRHQVAEVILYPEAGHLLSNVTTACDTHTFY